MLYAQVKVEAKVDAKRIEIGDHFHLFLEAEVPNNSGKLIWPEIPVINGFEIIDTGRLDSVQNGKQKILKQKLTITGFDSGAFVIPAFVFSFQNANGNIEELFSDNFEIKVNTLVVDTAAPIKPIKEIIEVEKGFWEMYWQWIVAGAIALLLIVFLIIWLLKMNKKQKNAPIVVENPYYKALRMLSEINYVDDNNQASQKQYYSSLTQILKDYFEQHLKISIAELTTDELMKVVKKDKHLRAISSELKHIFTTADLTKFAKAATSSEEQRICLEEAKQIVIKTKNKNLQEGDAI